MPDRISAIEQYNNRDLIAQIYRIISLTESSTIVRVTTTQEGSHVTVTLEMYDGTSKTFTFDCVGDVTTDTDQSINALKHFMMGIGITGPTHIDGDVRIVNDHYLQLAGDLDVGGDTELAGDLVVHGQSEISGMSFEESSGKTVISNDLGISTESPFEVPTTGTGERDTFAANGTRIQNDLDSYTQMLRTTGNQSKAGRLELIGGYTGYNYEVHKCGGLNMGIGDWAIFAEIDVTSPGGYHIFELFQSSNTSTCYGRFMLHENINSPSPVWIDLVNRGSNNPLTADSVAVLTDDTKIYLAWKKTVAYGSLVCRSTLDVNYGAVRNLNNNLTWVPESDILVLPNTDGYTHHNIEVPQ